MVNAELFVNRGGTNYLDAKTYTGRTVASTVFNFTTFGDSEYVFLIGHALNNGAAVQFSVNSYNDKTAAVVTTPTPTSTASVPTTSTKSLNWPLIIGCAVGGAGFIALVAFLIFYAVKVQRRKALNAKYQGTD
jgi:hypothetical protein